jgi:hypothetical protein
MKGVITLHGVRMEPFMKPPLEMNFSTTEQLSLSERWIRWKETMQLYLGLKMSKASEKEQCAAFRYVIGLDGRDIYNTMKFTEAQTDKIDVVFEKFDEYCEPRRNTIMERYKFNRQVQRDNKTGNQYVTELKLLAKNCSFGSLEDKLIRGRVVYRIKSERVREWLLRERDLMLDKALEVCQITQSAKRCSECQGHRKTWQIRKLS